MHNTIPAFYQLHILTDTSIFIPIFLQLTMQRTPCTQITPSKIRRENKYLISFFQNSIIHRYILAILKLFIYFFLFLIRVIIRKHRLEYICYLRLINTHCINNCIHIPNKDTGIPKEIRSGNIFLSGLFIRFLFKSIDTINLFIGRRSARQIRFNISITCFRTRRLHAKR